MYIRSVYSGDHKNRTLSYAEVMSGVSRRLQVLRADGDRKASNFAAVAAPNPEDM